MTATRAGDAHVCFEERYCSQISESFVAVDHEMLLEKNHRTRKKKNGKSYAAEYF